MYGLLKFFSIYLHRLTAMTACRIGDSANGPGGLRIAKQQWLLVPTNSRLRRDTIIGGENLTERDMEAIKEIVKRDGDSVVDEDLPLEESADEVENIEDGLFDEEGESEPESGLAKRQSRRRRRPHHRTQRKHTTRKTYGPY